MDRTEIIRLIIERYSCHTQDGNVRLLKNGAEKAARDIEKTLFPTETKEWQEYLAMALLGICFIAAAALMIAADLGVFIQ